MNKEEIALKLTEMVNENTNKYTSEYLKEEGVINTYKRILKELKKEE